jgi:hypothetical protein
MAGFRAVHEAPDEGAPRESGVAPRHDASKASRGEIAVDEALKHFLGTTPPIGLPTDSHFPDSESEAIIKKLSGVDATQEIEALSASGYSHFHSFLVLPSRKFPRWLLPLESASAKLHGFRFYQPYLLRGRLLKGFFVAAIRAGWRGWGCPRVLIAARESLTLERFIREVTGEERPIFSFKLGESYQRSKLTVQVMRPDGEILGYIKIPYTQEARGRVEHEAEFMKYLSGFPTLRPNIARPIFAGEWEGRYFLFQSHTALQACPATFGTLYLNFLQALWAVHQIERPGHLLVEEVAARWQKAVPFMNAEWQALGAKALAQAAQELNGVRLRCGISHGDFGPWHTRQEDGKLSVFDWEWGAPDHPNSWDVLNFHLGTGGFWNKYRTSRLPVAAGQGEEASYILFLLNSCCSFFEEMTPANQPSLVYRRRLISNELR